jgi:Cytochrome c554 and c-prime
LRRFVRDSSHLVRLAVVLIAAITVFVLVRQAVIPKAFGQYGHYRPGALEMIRQRPVSFAGQDACVACHDDEAKVRASGRHAHVACEACHGPQAAHATDPGTGKPPLPDVARLCRTCHEKDAAKPRSFPQVVTAEHMDGVTCNSCHQPHNPHV